MATHKRIKILTHGPIRVKGFINGPVLTPYLEDINTIFSMVSQGVHVVEVCNDKTEIRLTANNITEDNTKSIRDIHDNMDTPVETQVESEPEIEVDHVDDEELQSVATVDEKVEPDQVAHAKNHQPHHKGKNNKKK